MHKIPEEFTREIQHFTIMNSPDSVPWTRYSAKYRGAQLALANTFSVWIEIEKLLTGWLAR